MGYSYLNLFIYSYPICFACLDRGEMMQSNCKVCSRLKKFYVRSLPLEGCYRVVNCPLGAMASIQLCPGFLLQVFAVPWLQKRCAFSSVELPMPLILSQIRRTNQSWLTKTCTKNYWWTKHSIARPSKSGNPGFGSF